MPQSAIELCNNGLLAIGQGPPFIVALSDATKEARLCNQMLPAARRAVLRMHLWNFAMKRVVIESAVASGTNTGYEGILLDGDGKPIFDGDGLPIFTP